MDLFTSKAVELCSCPVEAPATQGHADSTTAEPVEATFAVDSVLYAGAPVWALDWCPHPSPQDAAAGPLHTVETLAVATHPRSARRNPMNVAQQGPGAVQVRKGCVSMQLGAHSACKLTCCEVCPSRFFASSATHPCHTIRRGMRSTTSYACRCCRCGVCPAALSPVRYLGACRSCWHCCGMMAGWPGMCSGAQTPRTSYNPPATARAQAPAAAAQCLCKACWQLLWATVTWWCGGCQPYSAFLTLQVSSSSQTHNSSSSRHCKPCHCGCHLCGRCHLLLLVAAWPAAAAGCPPPLMTSCWWAVMTAMWSSGSSA
jgi:hypothetical protein